MFLLLFLQWAITLLIIHKMENLQCTLTDATFTCVVRPNKLISSAKSIITLGKPTTLATAGLFCDNEWPASQPSLLAINDASEFIWGDVLKGIEELSHNVTAVLLMLQLGMMKSTCLFDQQVIVYQYSSLCFGYHMA